ncbi:hypothetical protein QTP86_015271 [Hemibagrus guttatus]|nr:hypothetical protein QTP86_015271 [Hemibagrus guttatus]
MKVMEDVMKAIEQITGNELLYSNDLPRLISQMKENNRRLAAICASENNPWDSHVHPFMETLFPDGCGLFQQDNAPCYKAKMAQEWFDEHNSQFEVLNWPPNSPDLNPIQHLWDVLDKQVRSMKAPPHNLQDINDLLLISWCQIPQHTFRDLVEPMPRQVKAVLAAKGGPTQN